MEYENYVNFEQAKALKGLGFDWECNHWYHPLEPEKVIECQTYCNHNSFERPYSAPTLAQAQKWLREVKGIDVHYHYGRKKWTYYWGRRWSQALYEEEYDTPVEALSAGIDKAIEFLKQENK